MGIFSAMNTAITGLGAQSQALEYISNNIANSQTVGYKRTEASFAELVQESDAKRQALGVVAASSRPTNDIQGQTQSSEVETHFAINGPGYFIVANLQSTIDGDPVFAAEDYYSRRGDFVLNSSGYLVNSTGYYLKGIAINPDTGNLAGSVPELIHVEPGEYLPAKGTTTIDYSLNLPSTPSTSTYDKLIADSELINPASFTGGNPLDAGTGVVTGADVQTFIDQSIAGGAVTSYTATGVPVHMELRWAKTDSALSGGTDSWEMFYLANSTASGATPAWINSGQVYSFDSDGQLNPKFNSFTIPDVVVDGIDLGDIKIDHTDSTVTQFATSNGMARSSLQQDGYAAGEFIGLNLSDDGRIMANYGNGRSIPIAALALANFASPDNLDKLDGGAFRQTEESGNPTYTTTGEIFAQALESSNTDIADEFSKLIITQQAYAANTRILTTGDKMMEEVLNMVR
jgi:flagellar hook protein FlgE